MDALIGGWVNARWMEDVGWKDRGKKRIEVLVDGRRTNG